MLVVAYNAPDHIAHCLEGIAQAAGNIPHEILLVDNGDGSSEQIVTRNFPDVRIIPSQGNIGYGAGNNLLARHASGEVLLIINPDAVLGNNSFNALANAVHANPQIAAFAANFLESDGRQSSENRILTPSIGQAVRLALGLWRSQPEAGGQRNEVDEIDAASGACFAIRRDWWRALGGFDARFFLYFEEVDLWQNLAAQDGKLARVAGFTVIHDTGTGQRQSVTRRQAYLRGFMTYCRKHFGPIRATLCGLAIWLFAMRTTISENGLRQVSAVMPHHWWRGWNDHRHTG